MLKKAMLWMLACYTSIRLGTVSAVVLMGATALPAFVLVATIAVSTFSAAVVVKTFSGQMADRMMQIAYGANILTVVVNLLYVKMFYPATIESYEYLVVGTLLEVVAFSLFLLVSTRISQQHANVKRMLTQN